METLKVLFHVDEMNKWKLTLANISNLLVALNDRNLVVEVVANSEAVLLYVDKSENLEPKEKISQLIQQGVRFVACNNALTAYQIDPKSIFSNIDIVKAGVAELVLRQYEGFAYLKP